MKLIKLFFAFMLISVLVVSCKETKKEESTDDSIEVTDESAEANNEATEGGNEEATHDASEESTESGTEPTAEGIEATSKELEEMQVAEEGVIMEKMADTPVVYPGCAGTVEEIRACSIAEFKKYFAKKFNAELANQLDLDEGKHKIRALLKIDKTGKVSVVKIDAEKEELEKEVIRVIGLYPNMTPATSNGEPVSVSFVLPVTFKVAS